MTPKLIRIHRLKQLQVERGAGGPAELGRIIGKSKSQTSDLLLGRSPFGERVARSIEEHAGLATGWLDEEPQQPSPGAQPAPVLDLLAIRPQGATRATGAFAIPLRVRTEWVQQLPPDTVAENLRVLEVSDDGMEPAFGSGDVLLVDVGVRECTRDGVYLLEAHGRTLVRRVRLRVDGTYEVSEDTQTSKSVETISASRLKVAARVLWAWVGRAF